MQRYILLHFLCFFFAFGINSSDERFKNRNTHEQMRLIPTSCSSNCLNCDSSYNCTKCKKDQNKLSDQCNSCIMGYYNSNDPNLSEVICVKCPNNCTNCLNGSNGVVNCLSCDYGFNNIDGACSICSNGYYNSNKETTLEKVICKQCLITCLTCSGGSNSECIKCRGELQKDPLESKCLFSLQIQSNIKEYNNIRNMDCQWEDRVTCQNNLDFSKTAANAIRVLSSVGISIGGIAGLFLPHVSASLWLFIQNQQLIGNNIFQSNFKKMGLSKYHLSNSYSFNLFGMIPPLIGSSDEMFQDKDYYTSEVENSRILKEEEKIQIRLLNQVESIKPLFIENCSWQILLIVSVFLLTPLMFILGRLHMIFQYIYFYMKWNLLIRVFMLTFNTVCIFIVYSIKNQFEFNSSTQSYSTSKKILSVILLISIVAIWILLQIQIVYYLMLRKDLIHSQIRAQFSALLLNVNDRGGISSMFWIIYSIKNFLQSLILSINDQNSSVNYWMFCIYDASLFLFLIIFDALQPKHFKIFICCQQAFQVAFNMLLAIITVEEDESKTIILTKNFVVFIIMMCLLNGLIVLSTIVWIVDWLFQIFIAKKKKKLMESLNQTQLVGHELPGNIEDILNHSRKSTKKCKFESLNQL